jgi:hypothetical protein
MTSWEEEFFRLLDHYARERHNCFVAELFLNKAKTKYVVCLRPTEESLTPLNRFACKYLEFDPNEVKKAVQENVLSPAMQEYTGRELLLLNRGEGSGTANWNE